MGEEGWAVIFEAVCSSTTSKIASIDASSNGIGLQGAKRIAEALKASVNASLTSLVLSNNISFLHRAQGPAFAAAIAEGLKANGSLTALNARYNEMGSKGKALLQDVVSGRAGFDLKV
jgi:hypothetical protein